MRKISISIAFLFVIAAGVFLYAISEGKSEDGGDEYSDGVHHIMYSFNLKNITSREVGDAKVWVSGPVAFNAYQKNLSIEANQKSKLFRDGNGNQELYFEFGAVPKSSIKHVNVDMQVAFSKKANKTEDMSSDQYLTPEEFVPISNSEIMRISTALKSSSKVETTKNILNWLKSHKESMTSKTKDIDVTGSDSSFVDEVKEARIEMDDESNVEKNSISSLSVLNKQDNSASGLLYLYLSLSRSLGIPTRGIVGFEISSGISLSARKATIWAEYYNQGYWNLVNLDDFKRVNDASSFIVFKILESMPGPAGWDPYSALHREAAFVVDVDSVKLAVR